MSYRKNHKFYYATIDSNNDELKKEYAIAGTFEMSVVNLINQCIDTYPDINPATKVYLYSVNVLEGLGKEPGLPRIEKSNSMGVFTLGELNTVYRVIPGKLKQEEYKCQEGYQENIR